jgi:phage tail-like protein
MASNNSNIPPPAFCFKVEFLDLPKGTIDTYFQEVSGLSWEVETEDLPVGGINDYAIRLPRRIKYPNLVLKRGYITDSPLFDWMESAIENYFVSNANPFGAAKTVINAAQGAIGVTTDIVISLMNESRDPILRWKVSNAYPLKWNLSSFNAMENKYVVETIEFGYFFFKRL